MEFREWWNTVGSGIRPAISSDMEAHAHFVASASWNAAQQNNKVAEQTPTNSVSTPFCPYYTKYGRCEQFESVGCEDCQLIDGVAEQRT